VAEGKQNTDDRAAEEEYATRKQKNNQIEYTGVE